MSNGPIHRRLPVRQRPDRGVGSSLPRRPLSLSRLPQATWGSFSRFRGVPSGCGEDRWRNTRLRRPVFLPPLRLVHLRAHPWRDQSEPGTPGCPWPIDADFRELDRPSRVLVAAVSPQETIRPRSRRHGPLRGVGRTNGATALLVVIQGTPAQRPPAARAPRFSRAATARPRTLATTWSANLLCARLEDVIAYRRGTRTLTAREVEFRPAPKV